MAFRDDLLAVVLNEWKRWGYSVRSADSTVKIGGRERDAPFVSFVNDYWQAVGHPTWNGNTEEPWSAAFISFCFKAAGAGDAFPYNQGHAGYCRAILSTPERFPGLTLSAPATTQVQVGDLIWAARSGPRCRQPPKTYEEALAALRKGAWFCSHADIVVEVRAGEVDAIGGNVFDSVTKTTFISVDGRIADKRHDWLGIIKNSI
jgi:hypothetical protein